MMRTVRTIAKRTIRAHKGLCLMSVMGLLGLMGCSSDQNDELAVEPMAPVFNQTTPISFSSSLADNTAVTRSQGLETSTTSFKVWAYKNVDNEGDNYTTFQTVMPGFIANYGASTAYTTTTNTNGWEYVGQTADQTIKYWDWGAKAYRFFAVAPEDASTTATIGANAVTITYTADGTTAETAAATPYYSDLWFSNGNAVTYPTHLFGKPVVLTFRKPFTLVNVVIHDSNGDMMSSGNLEYFTFKPTSGAQIATQAMATISYPLKGTADAAQVTCTLGEATGWLTTEKGITDDWSNQCQQYVLPATSQGNYQMAIKLKGISELRTCEVPAAYMNWKMGYEYTYIFKIDYNSVNLEVVLVGIKDWGITEMTHDVYNW